MYNKLMMCLLSLTVILSGCVQEEQPEEPPVVEEKNENLSNEEINNSIIDNNNHENDISSNAESMKKLSLIEATASFNTFYDYVNNNYFDYLPDNGKINANHDYVYIDESKEIDMESLLMCKPDYKFSINNSTNEYFNWLTSINVSTEGPRHKIVINLNGNQVAEINEYLSYLYNSEKPSMELSYRYNEANGILSLAIRSYDVCKAVSYGFLPYPTFFNIDLNTNLLLSNEDLLSRYGTTFEKAQAVVDKQFNELGIVACEEGQSKNCYTSNENLLEPATALVTPYSYVFIDDDGKLKMYSMIYSSNINQFNGYISSALILELTE